MKNKIKKILFPGLLLLTVLTLTTGCFEKRTTIEVKEDNVDVKIKIMEKLKHKVSKDIKDFKSSRESAMIIAKDFKIAVEINHDMSYEQYKGSFEKLKKSHSKDKDFKEVTYSGLKGFQVYNETFMRYEVYLPVKNTKEKCLQLNVYSTLIKEGEAKKQYQSKDVQDILNHVKVKYIEPKENKKK